MSDTHLAEVNPAPLMPAHEASAFSNLANFEAAQRMATMMSKSSMVPQQYQNNVPNCVIALEMANRIGASVFAVMQNLAIIHGRPSWEAKFIIAAISNCGRFSPLRFDISSEEKPEEVQGFIYQWDDRARKNKKIAITEKIKNKTCVASAVDNHGEKLFSPDVSIKMAVQEGWYSKSDSKWKTMPDLMLRYRAASFFGKLYAPDILMGMQTVEEMRDVIDVEPIRSVGAKSTGNTTRDTRSGAASIKAKLRS